MNTNEERNYLRLQLFSIDLSTEVVRDYAKRNLLGKQSTFKTFLQVNQHDIYHIWSSGIECCKCYTSGPGNGKYGRFSKEQFAKLYDISGTITRGDIKRDKGGKVVQTCCCNIIAVKECSLDDIDISTVFPLLLTFGNPSAQISNWITEIKAVRNKLCHPSGTKDFDDINFNTLWGRLETAVCGIAINTQSSSWAINLLKTKINELKTEDPNTEKMKTLKDQLREDIEQIVTEQSSVQNTALLQSMREMCNQNMNTFISKLEEMSINFEFGRSMINVVEEKQEACGNDIADMLEGLALKYRRSMINVVDEKQEDCGNDIAGYLLTTGIYCDGYFIDCDVHNNSIASHRLCRKTAKGSLLTTGIYCDGYFINCDVHSNLIASHRLCRKTTKDNMSIRSKNKIESTNEFESLVIASSYLKKEPGRLSLLNEDSFLQAVEKSRDLFCRLMLSYIDDSEATLLYLLKALEFAMKKRHNDISMSIAWRLTWVYFTRIKYIFPTLLDIWPALRCTCKNESDVQCDIFLSETVIVVQLDTEFAGSSAMFYSIPVIFYTDVIGEKLPLANRTIPYIDDVQITDSTADMLFDNHRNLTLICKSSLLTSPKPYRHLNTKSELIIKSRVQLYCKAKGLIPVGEKHFPSMFCGLATKVVQGTPTLMGGLQIGSKIGTDNFKKGTLGGFVRFRGEDVFLTCLHVFLTAEQLTADKITLDDNESYRVKCYLSTTAASNKEDDFVCGKIQDFGFEKNSEGTSVDAALIQLEKGIGIDSSHFLATTGLASCYLNDICVDYKLFNYCDPRPRIATVSIGAITGMSKTKSNVRVEKAVDTDIEAFEKTFSEAILDGMRAHALAVIQTLHSKFDLSIPMQERTHNAIEEICGAGMSAETKEGIAEIVDCIYFKTLSGDQPEKINQILNEVTIEKTTSKFSGILSDVHMQKTVLKMTIESAKRMSRRIYNQIHIPDIPFEMGDSGTCIYVVEPIKGCIGMAIASHPQGGCIATPIMEILKYFKIRFKDSS